MAAGAVARTFRTIRALEKAAAAVSRFHKKKVVVAMGAGVGLTVKALAKGARTCARRIAPVIYIVGLTQPLAGCFLLGSEMPDPALDIPQAYRAGPKSERAAEAALPKLEWWRGFRSRELTGIIEQARVANLDIAAAVARVVQADARARIAGATLLPAIDANLDASQSRSSSNAGGGAAAGVGGGTRNLYSASLSASYEIDFWGKNRAALRAADENAIAARYDREVVALSITAAAANAYFQMLAAQDRLAVARNNLAAATRVFNLIKQRLEAGTASQLDTAQQESLVNTQRAAIPPLTQTLRQSEAALALLIARPPERLGVRGGSLRNIAIPRVTPGLPSELIGQRPDIRVAEAQLAAANANVDNARAQFFPSIRLTGEGGYQSAVLRTLFEPSSQFYSIAAGLTQPVFDGFRLFGNLDLQKGVQDELLQVYRKAVIAGFVDVDNALVAIQQTALRERLLRDVVESSQRAFDISEQRLQAGTVDLVTVLNTQQTLFQAQDALAQARLARLQAVVSLYLALGGSWLPKPVEPVETIDAR
jgi:NodT family efflux transporter outer membrane factor (OMF) lipoprotein